MLKIPPYIGLWLLQIFCILFPMVLFQSFFQKKFKDKKVQKIILAFLCGFSIIICMTFPVSINKEYILDFRFIPLMIAFVFGGFRVGVILSCLLIAYRYMIGGMGFYLGGLSNTAVMVWAFWVILPRSKSWKPKWKEFYPYILLTFSLFFFALGTQFLDDYKFANKELILWIWFSLFNYLTLWMVLFIQNTIKEMETVSAKLIQFEKNHTVNQLLVSISCQLVVPLKRANEWVHSVQGENLTSRQTDSLRNIENELTQAERNLQQYLSVMDHSDDKQGTWNFVDELKEIIQLMKLYANMHQVEIIYTSTAEEDVAIKGEHSMIRFALMNIIKNAIEACEPRGKVNIYLHEMLKEIYIVIEDNGGGIPATLLERIDQPHSSLKENGTGLGLASTFKIAELLGGRVEVNSKPNEGTTFSLYFQKWAI